MKNLIKCKISVLLSAAMLLSSVPAAQAAAAEDSRQEIAIFERNPVFSGASKIQWKQGEPFDPESALTRVFADDLEDGDLTAKKTVLSNDVNIQEPGTYKVVYEVTDSDYHTVSAATEIEVGNFEIPVYQRRLYTIGKNQALLDADFLRGYYHDRQNLGIYMPAGSSLRIRIANAEEFQENLQLKMYNNDSETEQEFTIPKNGEWITVNHSVDSVPFILTPKASAASPVVEYQLEGAKELTYYRYGDDEEAFFKQWDSTQDTYAVIEGSAATFLVPYTDRNKIINYEKVSRITDRFQSLDEMLGWYQEFVDQYDEFSGLDYHASNPADQNIRSKFFIKANKHGAGQAYYTTDHSAFNGDTLQDGGQGYFCRYWLALHEFGHGYEGKIRDQELSLVETTNNIMAYYFEQTYLTEGDYGWLGNRASIEHRAAQVRDNTASFNEITAGRKDYAVSLYMFVNALDKIGPKKSTGELHRKFRHYRQEHGACRGASDSIIESFSEISGYNMIPYFETYHIQPSILLKSNIYQNDFVIPYYLRELVDTDGEAEEIKADLGLKGIYDLVTAEELKDTGFQSDVTIHLTIDDLDQIKGRKLLIKDGKKIVKEAVIENEWITLGELPIGAYDLELPNTLSGNYRYDCDFILAGKGEVTKEVAYEPVTVNLLADETQIRFTGLSDAVYASMTSRMSEEQMTLRVEAVEPHSYFEGQEYAKLTVLDEQGQPFYEKAFIGNEKQKAETIPIQMKEGYRIQIFYKEAGRLRFYNQFLDQNDDRLTPLQNGITTEYVMTANGLMKSEWSTQQQKESYTAQAESAVEMLKTNLSEGEQKNKNKNSTEKIIVKAAVDRLEEGKRQELLEQNHVLFYGSAPEARLLKKSIPQGRAFKLQEVLELTDKEDGDVFREAALSHGIPLDAEGNLTTEGIYPILYDVTDKDGNRSQGTIRFTVSPYVERTETVIPPGDLKASAESQEAGFEAGLSVDGIEQTCWKSQFSGSQNGWADLAGHVRDSIVVDLGAGYDVGRLDYVPDLADSSGLITKYKLYYSESAKGNSFKPIPNGEGIFEASLDRKTAQFDVVSARRLKLQALNTTDGRISASEICPFEVTEEAHSECTCVIEDFQIPDLEVTIPFDKDQAEAVPEPTASLGGNCKVAGHSQEQIVFDSEIIKDGNRIGSKVNERILVNGTGTLQIEVTARVNGKHVSKSAVVQAEKLYSERIPSETLTAFADSEQGSGSDGPGGYALDGNESSYWHSNYSSENKKPDITGNIRNGFTIDLGDTASIHRLDYVPRQDSKNGRILSYQLCYSPTADQDDFQVIPGGSGIWDNNKDKKQALFESVTARRIRILALSTEGNSEGEKNKHISAAEFYPYQLLKEKAEEYDSDCVCEIRDIQFPDDTVSIPYQAAKLRVPLHAEADLGAGCPVAGHGREAVVYEFTELEDPDYIGFIENGETLVLSKTGTITVRVSASIPGTLAKAEKTAAFTVRRNSETDPVCTCRVTDLVFDSQEIEIPYAENRKELRLQASSAVTGDCRVPGHQENRPAYRYEIIEDDHEIGLIAGDMLSVTGEGSMQVKVTAFVEGTSAKAEQTAAFMVRKEPKPDPSCTCSITDVFFENQEIEIPFGENRKELQLKASSTAAGDCQVPDHQTKQPLYRYEIMEDGAGVGLLSGDRLSVTGEGTILIKVTAFMEGTSARKEQTAVFAVTRQEPPCSCEIADLILSDQEIGIPAGEDAADLTLHASAKKIGNCQAKGHDGTEINYEYSIMKDEAHVGHIQGNLLTVTGEGCIQIRVATHIPGTEAGEKEGFSSITVRRESVEPPKPAVYTLTFDPCQGTVSDTGKTVTKGSPYGQLPVPVRTGYTFMGWYTGNTGGTRVTEADIYNLDRDSAVYARWKKIPDDIQELKPAKVTGLNFTSKTDRITIRWSKQTGITGYMVYRLDSGKKKWTMIDKTAGGTYTDKKLKYGTAYEYRVSAYLQRGNSVEEGDYSDTLKTATRPSRPSINVKQVSAKKVKLTWSKNTRADGFIISMKKGKEKFKEIKDRPKKYKSLTRVLKKGQSCQFKIRGYKKAGKKKVYGVYSKVKKFQLKKK